MVGLTTILIGEPNTASGVNPMRRPMPLRWIEEREARQVLAHARYDAVQPPFARVATTALWAEWLRRWLAVGVAGANEDATMADATAEPPVG